MELRQYWNVIWKRRWLVLAIIVVATLASAFMAFTAKRTFDTQVRFITRQEPSPDFEGTPQQMVFTFDRYYNWFGSEFLVDDYTQIVTSDAFAQSVKETLQRQFFTQEIVEDLNQQTIANAKPTETPVLLGDEAVTGLEENIKKITADDIKQSITSDRRHRELRVSVTSSDLHLTKAIADAAGEVLADAKMKPIQGEMVNDKAAFAQIDRIGISDIQSSRSKEITNAIIRIVIAMAAALALVFLLEYLDTSIRDERDANKVLDLPVLGAIPKA